MPHQAITITSGANTTETPTLNQTGIASCQLIRFQPDPNPNVGFLVQKLGGWLKFYASAMVATVRALWAWEDTQAVPHLAFGTQNISGTYTAQLGVITDGSLQDITPTQATDNIAPSLETTAGSSTVYINDSTITPITTYDSVYIATQISIGGLIMFGLYQCNPDGLISSGQYDVVATDTLGNPLPATSTATGGTLPSFQTTASQLTVTVTLPNHGYSVGSTFPVLVATPIGGTTFFGNYVVQNVTDANMFTINATTIPTSTASGFLNNGNAQFIYSFSTGSIPAGTGYGVGAYGVGSYGVGTPLTPATGSDIPADDWTLDNYGEILVAVPKQSALTFTTTGASGNGTTATLTFANTFVPVVGGYITVSGVTPSGYNGTYPVTASSAGSASYANTTTGAMTVAGTISAASTAFSPIYVWDPETGVPTAAVIPTAPPVNAGAFVAMPQRQIIAWGSTVTGIADPLLIRWCDVNNFNTWIGQITNQAGEFRLTKGSKIVGAIQGPQQGLIWTDIDVWSMQYIDTPYVYSFNEIGTGCGLIAQKAACSFNGIIYWMGPSQFFSLSGDGVLPVPCPVWDVVFQQLDQSRLSLIRSAVNSRFGEITWYFPTIGSADASSYIKYNTLVQQWDYGTLTRTAWVDQSVLGPPIGAGTDTNTGVEYLYQHDGTNPSTGLPTTDDDIYPMDSYFQTGYAAISEGELKTYVDQMWPDMKWNFYGDTSSSATVNLTIYFTDYPNQAPQSVGPYTLTSSTQFISPRLRGRLVSVEMGSSDMGSFWRMGRMRYRGAADGKF